MHLDVLHRSSSIDCRHQPVSGIPVRMSHRWDLDAAPPTRLVVPVRIDPEGKIGPTRGQARGPGWRSSSPGLWVPSNTSADTVEQRILEALAWAGPEAVATGWASLRLQGGGFFDGLARDGRTRLPVPIATNGERRRARPGIRLTEDASPRTKSWSSTVCGAR